MNDEAPPLLARHRALHQALLDRLDHGLVAAIGLDFIHATNLFAAVATAVKTHRIDEEAALDVLADEPPRGAGRTLIVAEHDKLDALLATACATLEALSHLGDMPLDAQRLALVRHLDTLLRAKHVLEHHTLRENEILYPHFVAHLPATTRCALEQAIATLLTQWP